MILYSIIIPHYNSPDLLLRLLKTIPVREDLEVIVVDDKSTNGVAELKVFEHRFPHVAFVYSQANGGAGKARNLGLARATGRYLIFADADDFFNICFDDVLNDYINETADLIFFASNSVDTNNYQTSNRDELFNPYVNNYNGVNDFKLRYEYAVPWGRMVSRDLVINNNISFQETIRHNDVGFSYLVGYYAKTIKVDKRAIYCCTTREGSVSTNVSLKALKDGLSVYQAKYDFLKSKGIDTGVPYYIGYALYCLRNDKKQFNECLNYIVKLGWSKNVAMSKYRRLRMIRKLGDIKRMLRGIIS